ncbi:MAG: thiamine-phosphate kinase [Planctomycetota bacterium]|nr:thiamine-phosphate kinase [Planctomycetota bacterium]
MTETEWIETFIQPRANKGLRSDWLGPGDDAALLPLDDSECSVLTVDALVEGQHFRTEWLDDSGLARRLLRSGVSDLTAMGARPRGLLLSIETPELPGRVGETFWDSVDQECQLLDLKLLGGNVVATDGPLALHATCIGSVGIGREWRRNGASVDDLLLVSGYPGRAAQAREQIAAGQSFAGKDPWTAPEPRLLFAATLSTLLAQEAPQLLPAVIDISDGLLLDLKRLCQVNGCGARIDIGALLEPVGSPTADQVLSGGEDYELLMAIPSSARSIVAKAADETGTPWHEIGTLTANQDQQIEVLIQGSDLTPENQGWDPFSGKKIR